MAVTSIPREQGVLDVTAVAGADLSAAQFYAMKLSSGHPLTVVKASAATDLPFGGLMTANTSGNDVKVRILGIGKAIAGAAITLGAFVTADSNGKFIVQAAGSGVNNSIWGIALGPVSNANELFPCLFLPSLIQGE